MFGIEYAFSKLYYHLLNFNFNKEIYLESISKSSSLSLEHYIKLVCAITLFFSITAFQKSLGFQEFILYKEDLV